jgi:tetratricopeptide (TPR) repeat protein
MTAQLYRGEAFVELRRGADALQALEGVLEYFHRVGPPERLVRALDALGGACWAAHRIEEAVSAYDRARKAYESAQIEEPDLLARVMGHMAAAHQHVGRHDQAIAAYEAGLAATEKYLDLPRRGHMYEGLAFSYYQAGNSIGALEYARKALRIFEQLHQLRVAARLQHNMAEIVVGMKRPAQAEQLYRRAIALARQAEYWELVPLSLAALAGIALQRGHAEAANDLLIEGLAEARKLNTPGPLAACLRVAARLAHGRQDWAGSEASFEEAIRAYGDAALIEYLAETHSEYASCLRERGELARAATHFEQAYELRRSGTRSVKVDRQESSGA